MLSQLRQRHYCPNLATKVQAFIINCQICPRTKLITKQHLRPPLQKIYDPIKALKNLLGIDLVGPLPHSNGFTYIRTAVDVFSRYIFAIPFRRPNEQSVVKGLILIFTRHAYVPNTILTDKGTTFAAQVVKQTKVQAGISSKHATIKHAQTIGMLERTHQKL